jgi:glycosyltransferase involved in cell wall biosynthesis
VTATPRLLIVEPFAPHSYLATEWSAAAERAGADVRAITWKGSSEGVPPTPWRGDVSTTVPSSLATLPRPIGRVWVASVFLRQARIVRFAVTKMLEAFPATHMIVSTTLPTDFLGLARTAGSVKVVAVVHGAPGAGRMAHAALQRYAGPDAHSAGTFVGCMTDRMRELYLDAGCDPCRAIEVPIQWRDIRSPTASQSSADGPITFIGEARPEKGFVWITETVQDLLELGPLRIQSYVNSDAMRHDAVVERLAGMRDSRLEIITERLSPEDYAALVEGSAAVLLAYDPVAYGGGKISGVLPEAWASGVPVLVSDGWWGADVVRRLGGGEVFSFGDADSLRAAMVRLRRDHARLSLEARAGYDTMLREQGPDAFVRFVLAL